MFIAGKAGVPERESAWQLAKDRFYVLRHGTVYDGNLGLVAKDPACMEKVTFLKKIFISTYIKKIMCYC